MAKGDIALYEHFLLLPKCFQKLSAEYASVKGNTCYYNITIKPTLTEEIDIAQLFPLLEGTKGYNLQSVMQCLQA